VIVSFASTTVNADQPEEAIDGLRARRLQGGDQADPELADDAFQVMTTAQGRKIFLPVASLCALGAAQATFLRPFGTFQAGKLCLARQMGSSPFRRAASSTAKDTTPASVHSIP